MAATRAVAPARDRETADDAPTGPVRAPAEARPEASEPVATPLTRDQALAAVRNHPEVSEWLGQFAGELAARAVVRVEADHGPVYLVHAFEAAAGGGGGPVAASFGWFEVDKATGEVTRVEL
jgi:hypothetical protein